MSLRHVRELGQFRAYPVYLVNGSLFLTMLLPRSLLAWLMSHRAGNQVSEILTSFSLNLGKQLLQWACMFMRAGGSSSALPKVSKGGGHTHFSTQEWASLLIKDGEFLCSLHSCAFHFRVEGS